MAVTDITLVQKRNKTVYFVIWDLATELAWDSADDSFKALGAAATQILPAAESPPFQVQFSVYRISLDLSRVHNDAIQSFFAAAYFQQDVDPEPTTDKPAGSIQLDINEGTLRITVEQVEGIVRETGRGFVRVDQDYGGENRICYIINGHPVDNAEINFFLRSDFDAGNRSQEFIVASSRTKADGTWEQAVMLDPAEYVLEFHKQNEAGPDDFLLIVTVDPDDSTLERLSPSPPQDLDGDDCVVQGLDAFGGDGTIIVDENFGGPGALTYEDDQGVPITNAEILFFTTADYNAGKRQSKDSVAASRQLASGAWQQAVKLDPGNYTIQFSKPGVAGPDTVNITVA